MFNSKIKLACFFVICSLFTANFAAAFEINFIEQNTKKELNQNAQEFFKRILPEADFLDLRVEVIDNQKTAVMTVLLDQKAEDGFLIMKDVPQINHHTYLVAWMLQGHFYFLKERATSPRQKRHLKLLSRYFDGRTISGNDTFYIGETVELFYKPMIPKVSGMDFNISSSDQVLYSGSPKKIGFAKILVPGFRPKYIAVLPKNDDTYAYVNQ